MVEPELRSATVEWLEENVSEVRAVTAVEQEPTRLCWRVDHRDSFFIICIDERAFDIGWAFVEQELGRALEHVPMGRGDRVIIHATGEPEPERAHGPLRE
jgi:hypothetical protein